jgi:lysophospholipase L1-like esterase
MSRMSRTRHGAGILVALAVSVMLAAACSAGPHRAAGPAVNNAGPKLTVLAIGGSATRGDGVADRLQDAWPYLVFHDAFPLSTVFVNGALDDATVAEAIKAQAPLAMELKPDLVEVWLGADDLRLNTPVDEFTQSLTNLIAALRAAGSRRILVADLPAAYGTRVAAYNAAIHQVVAGAHAELVPLAAAPIRLAPNDQLEPQPDVASHRVVAAAFRKAIRNPA